MQVEIQDANASARFVNLALRETFQRGYAMYATPTDFVYGKFRLRNYPVDGFVAFDDVLAGLRLIAVLEPFLNADTERACKYLRTLVQTWAIEVRALIAVSPAADTSHAADIRATQALNLARRDGVTSCTIAAEKATIPVRDEETLRRLLRTADGADRDDLLAELEALRDSK